MTSSITAPRNSAASPPAQVPEGERGDYQTPLSLCLKICAYLKEQGLADGLEAVLEPTCGEGNFLAAAGRILKPWRLIGIEINPDYVRKAQRAVPQAVIVQGNIFGYPAKDLCQTDKVLILGNPPWAMASDLKVNLPRKSNFKALRGIEALTGSANFDIGESVILQLCDEYRQSSSVVCMLCKTSAARRIMAELERRQISFENMQMLLVDPKIFKVETSICLLIFTLPPAQGAGTPVCKVRDFASLAPVETLSVVDGLVRRTESLADHEDLEGRCPLTWRSGLKHDCSKVLELIKKEGRLFNKLGEEVQIEPDLVYPLVKSSSFKQPVLTQFERCVIVTQERPGLDTLRIQKLYPKTWAYLSSHKSFFDKRQSVIYKAGPAFAMFGIGPYSFAPFKVGLSGFYKVPRFALFYSEKPVMADDTVYFLSFEDRGAAYAAMLVLNSPLAQKFLLSIAFLDSKRPFTAKLLARLDLGKCVRRLSFDDLKNVEHSLGLPSKLAFDMLESFKSKLSGRD